MAGFEPQPYGETWHATDPALEPSAVASGGSVRPDLPDDAACIRAVRGGDREAFAPLIERYQRRVYNLCLRYTGHPEDAADLTQEVFLRAFRAVGRFDLERSFSTWLMQIAVNACRDASRRRAVRARGGVPTGDEGPAEVPGHRVGGGFGPKVGTRAPRGVGAGPLAGQPAAPGRDDPAQVVERREAMQRLEAALRQLPPGDRLLVLLVHHQGYSLKEAAVIVDQTTVAVKARLFRARRRLRAWLQGADAGAGTVPGTGTRTRARDGSESGGDQEGGPRGGRGRSRAGRTVADRRNGRWGGSGGRPHPAGSSPLASQDPAGVPSRRRSP